VNWSGLAGFRGHLCHDWVLAGSDFRQSVYCIRLAKRVSGGGEKRNLLQKHLVELDQRLARVREHLRRLDPETAESLGLYEEARSIGEERKGVERDLAGVGAELPKMPSLEEIRRRSAACLDRLDEVLAGATIEEKRDLVQKYVRAVKACPDTQQVEIRLQSALFNDLVAGARVGSNPQPQGNARLPFGWGQGVVCDCGFRMAL
jgi:hypothetical protein